MYNPPRCPPYANRPLIHVCTFHLFQTKVVELDVSSGTALGFRLKKNPKGTGFVIRSVDDDGLASASGKINAGDYIVDVNGEDVSKTTQIKDIGKHIKNATTILTLTFAMSAADVKAGKEEGKKQK